MSVAGNLPSSGGRGCQEKVGFFAEGVRRDALRDGDQWIDATLMSILAPEWAGHRGRKRYGGRPAAG